METIAIIIKKLITKYIKGKVVKHFLKDICFAIVAVLIMFGNSFGRYEEGSIVVRVDTRQVYNYAKGLSSETMVGRVDNVVGVERIRFGCAVSRKVNLTTRFAYQTPGYWNGISGFHNGWDMGIKNEPIFSIIEGTVVYSEWEPTGGGWMEIVRSPDGVFDIWTAHMSVLSRSVGEYVKVGDYLGVSGSTGNSTAPHLHLTIKKYSQYVDPAIYISNCVTNP